MAELDLFELHSALKILNTVTIKCDSDMAFDTSEMCLVVGTFEKR